MYVSPITIDYAEPIIERIKNEQEEYIFRGIIQCGLSIDKDELIKALKYDRGQYDKGYGEGYMHGQDDFRNELNTEEYKNSILIQEIKKIMRKLLIISDGPGKVKPVKNTSKDDCYKALYKIQELLGTNKVFEDNEFNKLWEEDEPIE